MARRFFLVGASALALSACSSLLSPPDAPQIYVLKPSGAPSPQGAPVTWALSIQIPAASEALDSQRIALAHSDTTMDYYANAAWPDNLPMMVQTALVSAFEDSGRVGGASREQDALHADYTLALDIRDCAAHYSTPDGTPNITVTIVAQMATAHGRKVIANLTATQSQPASANAVEAVVEAMDAAMGAVTAQITAWALALPAPPRAP